MRHGGKQKYIESPEIMWEHFLLYKIEVKANPINIIEQKKGNIVIPKGFTGDLPDNLVKIPAQRPLTMDGFANWLSDNDIIVDVSDYFENKDSRYSNYIHICSRIKKNIRQDQIEGGMVGIYNPSITQRLNALVDKSETVVTKKKVFKIGYKTGEETNE
ncbi:MAG: terminase small subunit [Bacteroidota bacterium]